MHSLYFVAIIPPEDIHAEVQAFQERIADKYQSKAALKNPPHITLFPPVELQEASEKQFIALLNEVAIHHHPFEVSLNGFAAFPPRVIYVKPEKELRMNILSREIVDNFIHHIAPVMELRTFKFKAHITIAYRDLDPSIFPAAWGEFKNKKYERAFTVHEICLMRHDGKKWNVIHRSKLAQPKNTDERSLDLFT
jgi:2'-5' RNA ligase